jgi:hypothetical protein
VPEVGGTGEKGVVTMGLDTRNAEKLRKKLSDREVGFLCGGPDLLILHLIILVLLGSRLQEKNIF